MPFAFLAPLALAALGIVAAPVIIHMLRRARSRRLEFPSLRFLRETPSLVRRLTPPNRRWLMALRIAVIALIALAAARPVWTGGTVPPGSATVVLLDASASMRRPEARDAALAAAREVIGRLGDSDLACVAQFDRDVVWLGRDLAREDALAVLESYSPGGAAGLPAAAVATAGRYLESAPRPERRVVLISDFQRSNGPWTTGVEADSTSSLETIRIENAFGNAFVAETQVDIDENGERLACALVRSDDAGREVARIAVPLVDGAAGDGILVGRSGETWTARVTAPDGFDLDDVRYGVAVSRGPVVVCDPGAGGPFLAAASEVNFGARLVRVVPRVDDDALAGASVAIVSSRALDVSGASTALDAWVRTGGTALVFTASAGDSPPGFPAVATEDPEPASLFLAASPEAPAAVALRAAPVLVRPVIAEPGDETLVLDGEGRSVVVRRRIGVGVVTTAGFDATPQAGRLVYDGAFPDLVRLLAGGSEVKERDVGDTIDGLPADAIVELAGRRLEPGADGSVRLDVPGMLRVRSGELDRLEAVNVAAVESEPGQLSPDETAGLVRVAGPAGIGSGSALTASEQRWPIWRILLAVALVAALAELAIAGGRRRHAEGTESPDGVALPS